eukprot:7143127-Alexandrium_andersonii.AAC.1
MKARQAFPAVSKSSLPSSSKRSTLACKTCWPFTRRLGRPPRFRSWRRAIDTFVPLGMAQCHSGPRR